MASVRDFFEGGRKAHPFEGVEILNAFRIDHLDGHQLPIHQPLASVGYHPCGGEGTTGLSKATVRDPVAHWQKATPGGEFLKPV